MLVNVLLKLCGYAQRILPEHLFQVFPRLILLKLVLLFLLLIILLDHFKLELLFVVVLGGLDLSPRTYAI